MGVCSLRRCVIGHLQGLRQVKLFAIFREPSAKFVSGLFYFARWEQRKRLLSTHPANLTVDELDFLAMKSLQVRMKAPVQEYTVILGQVEEGSLKWGEVANDVMVAKAVEHLERDVAGAGVLERIDSFTVLVALELGWAPSALPCFDHVNSAPRSKRDGRQFSLRDFRADQRAWIDRYMAAERKVYMAAAALARRQEASHRNHGHYLSEFQDRCWEGANDFGSEGDGELGRIRYSGEVRIRNMRAPKVEIHNTSSGLSSPFRCTKGDGKKILGVKWRLFIKVR
eukprot:CAMPEP_0171784864 /NCGR_PEP_ID=MMETSP0991-20121206/62326_1 /TAXON_ID=483369 /ORGANISM="non described non described, Strain CCMP2098" /LENGTH=282 /DNA_ID=CAMNT_0012393241 /DNA_START=392 /DNA_END=1237 /DNA_ORIENTATION=+